MNIKKVMRDRQILIEQWNAATGEEKITLKIKIDEMSKTISEELSKTVP